MPKRLSVEIRLSDLAVVRQLFDDAYEAICSLESEGWDMLSEETKDEAKAVRERIGAALARLIDPQEKP